MTDTEEIRLLLQQILEVQRAHFATYQQVAERSLAAQQIAIDGQARAIRLQRIGVVIIFGLIGLLAILVVGIANR